MLTYYLDCNLQKASITGKALTLVAASGRLAEHLSAMMLGAASRLSAELLPLDRSHHNITARTSLCRCHPFCEGPFIRRRTIHHHSARKKYVANASGKETGRQDSVSESASKVASSSEDNTSAGSSGLQLPGGIDPKVAGALLAVAGLVALTAGGYVFRDDIRDFINYFIDVIEDFGPAAPLVYSFVYAFLELIIIPAVPLTMAAGVLFGVGPGLAVVSFASTAAAAVAFLITRYAARDKVAALAKDNKKFAAIDKAIGKDSFKVVLLLRLSPLLPLSLSNYLYGLTSVDFVPYVLGSWLGQLPGTFAYVSAGSYGRKVMAGADGPSIPSWQLALGVIVTVGTIVYIGRLAQQALKDVDESGDLTE